VSSSIDQTPPKGAEAPEGARRAPSSGQDRAGIDAADVIARGMDDPEFSREIRFFTGKLKICIGNQTSVVEFDDGALRGPVEDAEDDDCKIVVRGDDDHWSELLQPYPRPFYQCLQTTSVKHGLHMSTTNETYAYLPALNRLVVLMRSACRGGES